MRLRWRAATFAAIVVAAASVAGCGGSDDSGGSDRLSSAEFRQQVSAICRRAQTQLASVQSPTDPRDVDRWVERRDAIVAEAVDRLDSIAPPESSTAGFEELRTAIADKQEQLKASIERLVARDESGLRSASEAVQQIQARAARLSSSLGVETCAQF